MIDFLLICLTILGDFSAGPKAFLRGGPGPPREKRKTVEVRCNRFQEPSVGRCLGEIFWDLFVEIASVFAHNVGARHDASGALE